MKTRFLAIYPEFDLFSIGINIYFLRWLLMMDVSFWLTDRPRFYIGILPHDLNPDASLWHEWGHELPRILPRRLADHIYAKRKHPLQDEWDRLRTTGELGRIRMD